MTIDPKISLWLSIALTVIGALAISSTQLTDIFGPDMAHKITSCALLLTTIGNGVLGVIHGFTPTTTPQKVDPLGAGGGNPGPQTAQKQP